MRSPSYHELNKSVSCFTFCVLCLPFVVRALADYSQDLENEKRKICFLRFVSRLVCGLFCVRSPSYDELSGLKNVCFVLHFN